jgi:hypothetical protein
MNNSIKTESNNQYIVMPPSPLNENYWFQDLAGTIFNLDLAIKIIPNSDMTYAEKINALVRLSIYIGVILALFYANFLFLYIPILTMLGTYVLYLFRLDALDKTRQAIGPNAILSQISNKAMNSLMTKNMSGMGGNGKGGNGVDIAGETFEDILNIRRCVRPRGENPFMNPLVFDSRLRDAACDAVKPENQLRIEKEYNRHCIKDISDIWNHNSGRRQFYTVASTTYPHDQGAFANWLYKVPPTCKESSGAQCVANLPSRINGSLITPSFAQ